MEKSLATAQATALAEDTRPVRPEVIYADCLGALEEAWRAGLSREVPVRTLAPAILADATIAAEAADERLSPGSIAALGEAHLAAITEVWSRLKDTAAWDDAEQIALTAAIAVASEFQGEILCAALLREEDFRRPSAVVTVRHDGSALARRYFYFRAASLLAESPLARIVEVSASGLLPSDEPAPPAPGLGVRLASTALSSILYRLGMAFWRCVPFGSPRGSLLILRENELLKETAAVLMGRGYAVSALRPLPPALPAEAWPAVEDAARGAVERHFCGLLAPSALHSLARHAGRDAAACVSRYRASLDPWRLALDSLARRRPRAVLTNMQLTPEAVGLHRVLRELGLPLIGFQHGVTAEISAYLARRGLTFENMGCDLAITFNREMARLCAGNPFGGAPAVVAGLPVDYRRLARRRAHADALWYVSTSLYQANFGRLHRGLADADILARDMALIDRVLGRLPHRVVYKPYPAIRYLDEDPLLAGLARHDNIEVYSGRLDLRYVAHRARVVVTSGATSTVSWCLMSGAPTVFLDSPDNQPLRAEARDDFAAGLFLFDAGAADFHERLLAFLSQSFEEIERAWRARAEARKRLVETWFSSGHPRPAAVAADAVVARMKGGR